MGATIRIGRGLALAGAMFTTAVAGLAAPAAGADLAPGGQKGAVPDRPATIPGQSKGVHALGGRWIVAAVPGAESSAVAGALGLTATAPALGLYVTTEDHAVTLTAALRAKGLFDYAEPDVALTPQSLPVDPLTPQQWWVNPLIDPALVPPVPTSPSMLGIVDSGFDPTVPEFAGGHIDFRGPVSPDTFHGTGVASIATAPANGLGIVGLWPGAPARFYVHQNTCGGAAAAVTQAALDGVKVINMSYGVGLDCFSHYRATQFAFGVGSVLVAAAGNSYPDPAPLPSPANDPHVLTVGALDQGLSAAPFSSALGGLDLAAPGVGIPAAIPLANDNADGNPDGFQLVDGTSAAAPLVSAGVAWVRTVRPDLSNVQVTELMRRATRDVFNAGWDNRTGFGIMDLNAALTLPAPRDDTTEPNDDIEWIDGRRLTKEPALLRTKPAAVVNTTLDYFEDPIDIVPVYLPKASRLRVDVVPQAKRNVNVEVFSRKAKTVFYSKVPPTLKARGYKKGAARETVFVTNRGSATVVYVTVYVPNSASFADAGYRLLLKRTKLVPGTGCGPVTPARGCVP